jgi:Bacterial regulatory protein, arsR family
VNQSRVDVIRAWPIGDAEPLPTAPPGTCTSCGCALSVYREPSRRTCWPCGGPDTVSTPVTSPAAPARTLILTVLAEGPLRRSEIAERTGIADSTAKQTLRMLVDGGVVIVDTASYARPVYTLVGRKCQARGV